MIFWKIRPLSLCLFVCFCPLDSCHGVFLQGLVGWAVGACTSEATGQVGYTVAHKEK